MPKVDRETVRQQLEAALASGDPGALETYLAGESALPGPRGNLELIAAIAERIGEIVTCPDPPLQRVETLLDGWAALTLESAPVNNPREILPAMAALAYGQVAVVRPEWWDDEIGKLRRMASDARWRTREMVAAALQRMLGADWSRTAAVLREWVAHAADLLVMRAVVAAVAEPPLLTDPAHAGDALALHREVIDRLGRVTSGHRRKDAFRALRQGLGYSLSVVIAALPEPGFAYLDSLAVLTDPDIRWIVRENLKKNRLQPWAERVAALQARL